MPEARDGTTTAKWDTAYEWRALVLLSLGFGLVAFDRFLVLPMYPIIMRDLHLDYADLGRITGALAITWGISAFVVGRWSDRIGRRRMLVGAMLVFSILVGLSGLAAGALSLIAIRALMGTAEGAYAPPSLVATLEASKPSRHGFNLGMQQATAPLLGLALAPILVTQLMQVIDWRYIFLLTTPPGILIAFLLWRTVRDPIRLRVENDTEPRGRLRDLGGYRNVSLAALIMLSCLNALVVLTAFLPSYMIDQLKLPISSMGYVMSAVGFGAVCGSIAIPALSDLSGRKPAAVLAVIGAAAALVMLSGTGADARLLFTWLLITSFFLYGLISLNVGPLSIESVPVHLRATASGVVIAVGELFGGGVAPIAAGYLARSSGIAAIFPLAIGGFAIGLIACLALVETAPVRAPSVRSEEETLSQ